MDVRLAKLAVDATTRDEWRSALLLELQRVVGFDYGIVWTIGDAGADVSGFDVSFFRRFAAGAERYEGDIGALIGAAAVNGGVVRDSDALSQRRRERSSFYAEIIRPIGSKSFLTATVAGVVLQLGRTASFARAAPIERLGELLPVIALAERVHARPALACLTPREREVVDFVVLGYTNKEIAAALDVSPNTVRNQLASVFTKAHVSTRAELVGWALRAS